MNYLQEVMHEVEVRDPLLKVYSAQAIRILTQTFFSSEYAMTAAVRVQELSQFVSYLWVDILVHDFCAFMHISYFPKL